MYEYLMSALTLSPLLLTVFLILKLRMPIHYSVLISSVFTAALSTIFWEMPVRNLKTAIGYDTLRGLWPIMIMILDAIFSYNVMQTTKALDILCDILVSASEDKCIRVLLISWCFGEFLEAAVDYETAVATLIDILIVLGFNLLKAAIASPVTNTVPTAFGAIGAPVFILTRRANLPAYILGGTIILQLALFNILLPFVIVCIVGGGLKATRGIFLVTLICGIPTLVPQYFVATHPGTELLASVGSPVSLFAVTMVSRLRKGKTDPERRIKVSHTCETTPYSAKVLFRMDSIYLFVFVFVLLCSPLFPTTKSTASQLAPVPHFTLANGKAMALKVERVTTPGTLIVLATIIGGFIQGASAREMLEVFIKTIFQLKNSIVTAMAIVALTTVMDLGGIISTLVWPIVDLTGSSYALLAPVISALDAFVTSSDINSSILFDKLQIIAASKLRIDPNWLTAANTSGVTGGKMTSPQNIVIAVSATKMDGQVNQIMSSTMKYCYAYIVIPGLEVSLFYYWFIAQVITNPVKSTAIVSDDTMTRKVYTAPGTEQGDRPYDLSALAKTTPVLQIEDCCCVVLEEDGEEVRRLFHADPTTLLPRVISGIYT